MFANPVDQVGAGRLLALFILRERTKHLQEEVANRRFLAGAQAGVKGCGFVCADGLVTSSTPQPSIESIMKKL